MQKQQIINLLETHNIVYKESLSTPNIMRFEGGDKQVMLAAKSKLEQAGVKCGYYKGHYYFVLIVLQYTQNELNAINDAFYSMATYTNNTYTIKSIDSCKLYGDRDMQLTELMFKLALNLEVVSADSREYILK